MLIMPTSLLFLPTVFHNSDLSVTFHRIKKLRTIADHMYFPLKYASKLVQRFPSLTYVEIDIYSMDSCISIVDILIDGLPKLRRLVVQFFHDSLLDDPISKDYIIEKRRQSFGLNRNDEYKVVVTEKAYQLFISIP